MCSSVKVPNSTEHKKFELLTAEQTYEFYVDSDRELLQWTALLEDVCQDLVRRSIGSPLTRRVETRSSRDDIQPVDVNITPEKKELGEIMKLSGNLICADCDAPSPEWASVNLGIFICIACSGAHRNLGTHISKVRSCILDEWEPEMVQFMKMHGNEKANTYWEHNIPKHIKKPTFKDGQTERQNYIHAKYERKEFTGKASDEGMVFLCWEDEGKWFGYVETSTDITLATLRTMIDQLGIQVKGLYQFLFRKAPVTTIQEQKKTVLDCLIQMERNPTILLRKI